MAHKRVEGSEQRRRAGGTAGGRATGASQQPGHVPGSRTVGGDADVVGPAPEGTPDLSPEHGAVFQALVEAQRERLGEAVGMDVIARRVDMSAGHVRALLHDLATVHRLVGELQQVDVPDLGPRFEVKPRL